MWSACRTATLSMSWGGLSGSAWHTELCWAGLRNADEGPASVNCAWPPPTGGHDDQGRPVFLGSDSPQRAAPEGRQGLGRSGWPAARSPMALLATRPARGCVTGPHRPRGLICAFQSTPQDAPCGSDDALGAVTWGPLGDDGSDHRTFLRLAFSLPRDLHATCHVSQTQIG